MSQEKKLRRSKELGEFAVHASDGEIGQVSEFIFATDTWSAKYLVVQTNADWSNANVLIPTEWIDHVDWEEQQLHVTISSKEAKESPTIDSRSDIDRPFEEEFYAYYQRHPYWLAESEVDEASWESFPASDPPARW